MLILGDRRIDKLRAFLKQFRIRLPSNKEIREKEQQLLLKHQFTESTRKYLVLYALQDMYVIDKVEKIIKGSLDLIPSPSPLVKIQIMGRKVYLRY